MVWWRIIVLLIFRATIRVHTQLDSHGFLIIDCGLSENSSYVDSGTNLTYVSDEQFIDINTGVNSGISYSYISDSLPRELENVRSFPTTTYRNCYTLRSLTVGSKYIIRAAFYYANYDGLNKPPIFDIYLGDNFWDTVNASSRSYPEIIVTEIMVTATADYFQVCLVNKKLGNPFISSLLLTQLNQSNPFVTSNESIVLKERFNVGASNRQLVRYPDDAYDRWWWNYTKSGWKEISTNSTIPPDPDFEVPSLVMQTAATSSSTKEPLNLYWTVPDKYSIYCWVFHFNEIQPSLTGRREFDVVINGYKQPWHDPIIPESSTGVITYCRDGLTNCNVSMVPRSNSTLPPLLNAFEMYKIVPVIVPSKGAADSAKRNAIIIAIAVGVPLVVIIVVIAIFRRRKYKQSIVQRKIESYESRPLPNDNVKNYENIQPEILSKGAHQLILNFENRKFSYNDLKKITNGFKDNIGTGGFGGVYLGHLEDGLQVAVKVLTQSSKQGIKEFLAEVENLTRARHKNLVLLMGYCIDKNFMALVYEYMQAGSLHDKLKDNEMPLSWKQRLQIAYESALGLEYLHKACNPPLIHRDVKTSNILLNGNLEAKIADFGLCRAFDSDAMSHVSTNVVGTPGYLDPEYYISHQLRASSDVFSFGVVLLEIITGRPPISAGLEGGSLLRWVRQKLSGGDIEGIVDPRMEAKYDINSVWKVTDVACRCTELTSSERPSMAVVVAELMESLHLEMAMEEIHIRSTENSVTDISHDNGPSVR